MPSHAQSHHPVTGPRLGTHASGQSAEQLVACAYKMRGASIIAERFRGGNGEIDLIISERTVLVFVEVKYAKSRDTALARVTADKAQRLRSAAEAYLASNDLPDCTELRFDIATVDHMGRTEILENAIWFD